MAEEKEYPLYPTLSEGGEIEAQKIIEVFKRSLVAVAKEVVEETISDMYCDIVPHIESDSWDNFRHQMLNGFKGYEAGASSHAYDFKELRQAIYKNNKIEIVKDLNSDLVEENLKLKGRIKWLEENCNRGAF